MQSSLHRIVPELNSADPERAYRKYLAAIARRDIEAVLDAMTEDRARQLRQLRRTRDFGPLFALWCESQRDRLVISGCQVDGDTATLNVRGKAMLGRIDMQWIEGAWRIALEQHLPPQRRAAD